MLEPLVAHASLCGAAGLGEPDARLATRLEHLVRQPLEPLPCVVAQRQRDEAVEELERAEPTKTPPAAQDRATVQV